MRYRGQLLADPRTEDGLRVVLELEEDTLSLTTLTGERLGSWDIMEVAVERADGDRFSLTLGGEALVFAADDRLGFAYTGAPAIEKHREKLGSGWRGRRRSKKVAARTSLQPTPHRAPPVIRPGQPNTATAPGTVAPVEPLQPLKPAAGPIETPEVAPRPAATTGRSRHRKGETPSGDTSPSKKHRTRKTGVDAEVDAPETDTPAISGPEEEVRAEPVAAPLPAPDTRRPTPRPVETAASSGADPFGTEVVLDLAAPEEPESPDTAPMEAAVAEIPEPVVEHPEPAKGRLGILDRVRRQKVEHVHEYTRTALAGGLVRHVCLECKHVSIGSVDDASFDTQQSATDAT